MLQLDSVETKKYAINNIIRNIAAFVPFTMSVIKSMPKGRVKILGLLFVNRNIGINILGINAIINNNTIPMENPISEYELLAAIDCSVSGMTAYNDKINSINVIRASIHQNTPETMPIFFDIILFPTNIPPFFAILIRIELSI